jgi:hypothetical protein
MLYYEGVAYLAPREVAYSQHEGLHTFLTRILHTCYRTVCRKG